MSKIMRQLEAEGRAAREALARKPDAPPTAEADETPLGHASPCDPFDYIVERNGPYAQCTSWSSGRYPATFVGGVADGRLLYLGCISGSVWVPSMNYGDRQEYKFREFDRQRIVYVYEAA